MCVSKSWSFAKGCSWSYSILYFSYLFLHALYLFCFVQHSKIILLPVAGFICVFNTTELLYLMYLSASLADILCSPNCESNHTLASNYLIFFYLWLFFNCIRKGEILSPGRQHWFLYSQQNCKTWLMSKVNLAHDFYGYLTNLHSDFRNLPQKFWTRLTLTNLAFLLCCISVCSLKFFRRTSD